MRVMITGAQGFVGRQVLAALSLVLGRDGEIYPSSRGGADLGEPGRLSRLDVTDALAVRHEVSRIRPTHVVHLAGLSTISAATSNEDLAWKIHVGGTLNIARAIRESVPKCVLLYVGSGQVYGASARTNDLLTENTLLAPTNAQMASKAAADLALGAMAEDGLQCIRFRPFNHTGPGQSENFALPSFAFQIARIKAGLQPARMLVGNLDVVRDFLDVRDVAAAYVQAILKSPSIQGGEIFNVASSVPRRIGDILDEMIGITNIPIAVETDRNRVRPTEILRFVGDATKARERLAWSPVYAFEQTLREIVTDAEVRMAQM